MKKLITMIASALLVTGAFALSYDNGRYIAVEYVDASGSQFIDTGVSPEGTNLKATIDVMVDASHASELPIFGSTWAAKGYFLMVYQGNVRFHTGDTSVDVGQGDSTWRVGEKMHIVTTKHGVTVGETSYALAGGTDSADTIELCSVHGSDNYATMRIYSFVMENETTGEVLRNFVPVRDTAVENPKNGFWDTVEGKFYCGSASFAVGPDVDKEEEEEDTKTITIQGYDGIGNEITVSCGIADVDDQTVVFETSRKGDFTDAKVWEMSDNGEGVYSCVVGNADATYAIDYQALTTYAYRVKVGDSTEYAFEGSFTTGDFFCNMPGVRQAFTINGTFCLDVAGNDLGEIQVKKGDQWETISLPAQSGNSYCYYFWNRFNPEFTGVNEFRVKGNTHTNWNYFTVDSGTRATGTTYYNGKKENYYNAFENAFDGNPGSYFHAGYLYGVDNDPDQALYLDMGASKYIGYVAVISCMSYGDRVGTAVFEGANKADFSDAVTLYAIEKQNVEVKYYGYEVNPPKRVRYVRIRPNGGGMADNCFNVGEVEFRTVEVERVPVTISESVADVESGLVSEIDLTLSGITDGCRLYTAYGPEVIRTGDFNDWPDVTSVPLEAGTTQLAVTDFPAGWGDTVKALRFFITSNDGTSEILETASAVVTSDNAAAPVIGTITPSNYVLGNEIGFSVVIDESGSGGVEKLVLETSVKGDFSDAFSWILTDEDQDGVFTAVIGNADEFTPVEFPCDTKISYRARAFDALGHETLTIAEKFITGKYFCSSPYLPYGAYAMCSSIHIPLAGVMNINDVVIDMKDDFGQWQRVTDLFGTSGSYLYTLSNGWQGRYDFRVAYAVGGKEPVLWTEVSADARYRVVGEVYYFGMTDNYYQTVQHVVDNDLGSIYHAAYEVGHEGNDPSIYMDFGSEIVIAQAAIYYSSGYGVNRIGHVVFEAADDREFTTNVRELHTLTDEELQTGAPMAVCSFEPTLVRYVRARPQAGTLFDGWFNVGELEFGLDPTTANLSVSVEDSSLPGCWPTLRFSRGFNPDSKVAVYRSTKENSGYRKVAEIEANWTSWTDETAPLAKRVWYRLARMDADGNVGAIDIERVSFTRGRLLPIDAATVSRFVMNAPSEYASVVDYVFTGSETPNGYLSVAPGRATGGWDRYDPLIGIDYRPYKPVHITMCRFHPQTAGYHTRMNGVQVFGSNDADTYQTAMADDPKANGWNFIEVSTAISEGFNVPMAKWYNYVCDDTTAYDFVYLGYHEDRGMDDGWLGDADEIRFYGYTDNASVLSVNSLRLIVL